MRLRTTSSTPAEEGLADDHRQRTHRASWCRPAVEETAGYLRHTVRGTLAEWGLDSVADAHRKNRLVRTRHSGGAHTAPAAREDSRWHPPLATVEDLSSKHMRLEPLAAPPKPC